MISKKYLNTKNSYNYTSNTREIIIGNDNSDIRQKSNGTPTSRRPWWRFAPAKSLGPRQQKYILKDLGGLFGRRRGVCVRSRKIRAEPPPALKVFVETILWPIERYRSWQEGTFTAVPRRCKGDETSPKLRLREDRMQWAPFVRLSYCRFSSTPHNT